MATNPNSMVQEAVDAAISKRGEIGLQVVAYVDGKQVVDVWGGLADISTGRQLALQGVAPAMIPARPVWTRITRTAIIRSGYRSSQASCGASRATRPVA